MHTPSWTLGRAGAQARAFTWGTARIYLLPIADSYLVLASAFGDMNLGRLRSKSAARKENAKKVWKQAIPPDDHEDINEEWALLLRLEGYSPDGVASTPQPVDQATPTQVTPSAIGAR